MYALNVDNPFNRKGHQVLKVKQHLILVSTHKKSEDPGVKLQNYTVFVCMHYVLILLVMERVISSLRSKYKTTPNSVKKIEGLGAELQI